MVAPKREAINSQAEDNSDTADNLQKGLRMRRRDSTTLYYQRRGLRGEGSSYQNPSASPARVSLPLFWDRHLSHVRVTHVLRDTMYAY